MKSQVNLPPPPQIYDANNEAQARRAIAAEDLRNVKVDDRASANAYGVVKVDGTTITATPDGTISVPASVVVAGSVVTSSGTFSAPNNTATTVIALTTGIWLVTIAQGVGSGQTTAGIVVVQDTAAFILTQNKTSNGGTLSFVGTTLKYTQTSGSTQNLNWTAALTA